MNPKATPPPLPHLQFALSEQCAELCDALCCDGAVLGLVLGHLVLQGDEADGGALLFLQAEELQDALVVVNVAVDENKQDLGKRGDRVSIFKVTFNNTDEGTCVSVTQSQWTGSGSQLPHLTLEPLCSFLKLVHFVLEV